MKKVILLLLLLSFNQIIFGATDNIERIAVAGGSITEIIYQLNQQHRIVGVDSTSQFPEAAKNHSQLGYVRNLSVEGVLSLKPDLLIGEADTGPTKVVNQIKAAGINTVIIDEDNTIDAIKHKIKLIAELLHAEPQAKELLNTIQYDIDAIDYAKQYIDDKPSVLFLLSVANGAPIAAGNNTSAHTAIIEAFGKNVLAQYEGWEKLSPESALSLNPDVIIVMNRAQQDVLKQLKKLPHFKYSQAVKDSKVFTIDGSYLLGFGPRTPQAIVELGTMIHAQYPLPEGYRFHFARNKDQAVSGH